jgi:hypothetical protein
LEHNPTLLHVADRRGFNLLRLACSTSPASLNMPTPKNGKTALQYGIEKEFAPAELTWLVRHGASRDLEDHDGATARSCASRKRDRKWLRALG